MEKYRVAEQERQARCRAKKRAKKPEPAASSCSLPPEVETQIESIAKAAFSRAPPSRSALCEALRRLAYSLSPGAGP